MQVDVIHRNDLGISAACGTALNTEYRSEGRFAKSEHRVFILLIQGLGKSDTYGRFAFSCRSRVHGRNQNELAVLFIFSFREETKRQLRFVFAVEFQVISIDPEFLRDLFNRQHFSIACDLNVT